MAHAPSMDSTNGNVRDEGGCLVRRLLPEAVAAALKAVTGGALQAANGGGHGPPSRAPSVVVLADQDIESGRERDDGERRWSEVSV
ncbi:unnamed protein product [Triticum turgidum subsp. durum]|nr:unnamed protein product [Triticum turgidum subsp. durum]